MREGATAGAPRTTSLLFRWIGEDEPGPAWIALFERAWPAYRTWFLREGEAARPPLGEARARLRSHMPELLPVWERLSQLAAELVGDTRDAELAARLLALYRPPRYLAGCSQAVWSDGRPMLVRNYDFAPWLFEGTVLVSSWRGESVIATSDCLWGALDGMSSRGLTVALAFGGRREVGDGFGIALILRYVLETCATVEDALAVLRKVPSHMAYNVSVLDASGAHAVAYLRPGHRTRVSREPVCSNHQPGGAHTAYARATRSGARKRALAHAVRSGAVSADEFVQRFLEPPLRVTDYHGGYGTLYTAVFRPSTGQADFVWPDLRVRQRLDRFEEAEVIVALG